MKKMFLVVLTTVFCVGLCFAEEGKQQIQLNNPETTNFDQSEKKTATDKGISINIDWGRPSKNCKGFGICGISICLEWSFGSLGKGNNSTPGTIEIVGNEIIISLDEGSAKGNTELSQNLVNKGNAKFEEGFSIPTDVMKKLGKSGEHKAKAGDYKVTQEKGKILIHIPL